MEFEASGYRLQLCSPVRVGPGRKPRRQVLLYIYRVVTVREKSLENEIFSRSGKSQGNLEKVVKVREFENFQKSSLLKGF